MRGVGRPSWFGKAAVFFVSASGPFVDFGVWLGSQATTSSHIPTFVLAGLLVEGFVRLGMGGCELNLNCFRGDQSHPSGSGPRWRRHYGGGQFLRGIISGTARRAVEEAPDDKDLNCYSPLKSQGTFETGTPSTCPALEMPRSSATSWGCSMEEAAARRRSRRPLPPIEPTTMMQLRCSGVKKTVLADW